MRYFDETTYSFRQDGEMKRYSLNSKVSGSGRHPLSQSINRGGRDDTLSQGYLSTSFTSSKLLGIADASLFLMTD